MGKGANRLVGANKLRNRLVTWTTGSAATAVALLMVLAPAVQGAVLVAPFHGTVTEQLFTDYFGCHASSKVIKKPSFSLATGAGGYAGSASVKSCAGPIAHVANGLAENGGGPLAELPVTLATGANSVSATFAASWAASGSISIAGAATPCPTSSYNYFFNSTYYSYSNFGFCAVEAETYLLAEALVYDGTNNTWFYPTGGSALGFAGVYATNFSENYTQVDWGCYDYNYASPVCYSYNSSYTSPSMSWSNTGSTLGTGWVNMTAAVHSHHYYVVLEITSEVFTYITEKSGATAKASMNVGTLGNGWKVTSVVT